LRYASGGHPPALLYAAGQEPAQLSTRNFFIGGFPGVEFSADEVTVPPEGRLYIFSDGVYEVDRPDGTMWSLEDLQAYLSGAAAEPGAEIEALYKNLQQMHERDVLDDDFSMVEIDFR
jgi:sigma-B regulation protein RsbU (phosphoserine phosphatase)